MEHLSELLSEHRHVFLHGSAGTGKSTLLQQIRIHLPKQTAVLAPTGIAALHVMGETIHGFFQFKPHITPEIAKELGIRSSRTSNQLYRKLEALIIDEISMVRADLIDAIDQFLRHARDNQKPFGGVQLWLFGDLLQLPPVVGKEEVHIFNGHYESPYFYHARVFSEIPFTVDHWHVHELIINYRQQDTSLAQFLEQVRKEDIDVEHLSEINMHLTSKRPQAHSIYLTTTNKRAFEINTQQLAALPGSSLPLLAKVEEQVRPDQYPCAETIEIKVGARIMLVNNDPMGRWQNGSLGYIEHIDIEHIEVLLDTGKKVRVKECTWDIYTLVYNEQKEQLENKVIGKFHQYPVTLAWAVTIHKAQGKSFDHVHIDLERGAFTEGQTYVALSRARTLDGLSLEKPLRPYDLRMPSSPREFLYYLSRQF